MLTIGNPIQPPTNKGGQPLRGPNANANQMAQQNFQARMLRNGGMQQPTPPPQPMPSPMMPSPYKPLMPSPMPPIGGGGDQPMLRNGGAQQNFIGGLYPEPMPTPTVQPAPSPAPDTRPEMMPSPYTPPMPSPMMPSPMLPQGPRQTMNPGGQALPSQANPRARQAMMNRNMRRR